MAERNARDPLGIGLIGTRRYGSRYVAHVLTDLPQLWLAAISRRSSEGAVQARRLGVRHHAHWEDLVRDLEVEAVIVVLTLRMHEPIAEICAAERKPLLLEKPLAVDGTTGARIVELFREAGVPLNVAQTLRYNTTIRSLKSSLPCASPRRRTNFAM